MTPQAIAVPPSAVSPVKKFTLAAIVVTALFALPLWKLLRFAVAEELYSYIPLILLVSGYLAWQQRPKLPGVFVPTRALALPLAAAGAVTLAAYFMLAPATPLENQLSLSTLAWELFLTATGLWFLGVAAMRVLAFPLFLLLFMIPLPVSLHAGIEAMLQHGSATVADWFFTLAGMPEMRDGTMFRLPGLTLEVAPECSGIHSTVVLLITGVIAARMVLQRSVHRAVLCLVLIPLALLRNGFRVFVIGELCVHISPAMINSPIHRHGGPLFFVLSLIPFFWLLYGLKKRETGRRQAPRKES